MGNKIEILGSIWFLDDMNFAYVNKETEFEIWPSRYAGKKDGKFIFITGWAIGYFNESKKFIYLTTEKTKEESILSAIKILERESNSRAMDLKNAIRNQ